MPIFFLILIAVFFFPYLLIPFTLFFLILLFLLPLKFTFDSMIHLINAPSQILQIARNPILRKNHSLEHATVNVLEREYGYQNLAGYAREDGFFIQGIENIYLVEEAARKGLALLKRGRSELAVHRRCGTSMTVANFTSAVIFLLLLVVTGYFSILNMIIAILLANFIGPYLGEIMQKQFTTTSDIQDMEIVRAGFNSRSNLNWNRQGRVFVKTQSIPYLQD